MSVAPPGSTSQSLTLAVGTVVVYGSYGIGRVAARDGDGTVVIQLPDGLSVTLPARRAVECLRPLAGDAELALVQAVLRSDVGVDDDSWQTRTRTARGKLVAGGVPGLAEMVRDGARRDREASSREAARPSSHERSLYLKARALLASEVALALGIEDAAGDAWIDEQLTAPIR